MSKIALKIKVENDRIGERIISGIGEIVSSIQDGYGSTGAAHFAVAAACQRVDQASLQFPRIIFSDGETSTRTDFRSANPDNGDGKRLQQIRCNMEKGVGKLMISSQNELEKFKKEFNLAEYAQLFGYKLDPRNSGKSSLTMKRADGDKIVIATAPDGHWIFFNVRDNKNKGSIIDFHQHMTGENLGYTRKALRAWAGGMYSKSTQITSVTKPQPIEDLNICRVIGAYSMCRLASRHPYLESRGISPEILQDGRFSSCWRNDDKGNAVFPHFSDGDFTGFELKNRNFTGFSKGGKKGLWFSQNLNNSPRLIIVESAIDALSHAQLYGDIEASYISIGGQMSPAQHQDIRCELLNASLRGASVIIATDNDSAGNILAHEIAKHAPNDLKIYRHTPNGGKDWNDILQNNQTPELRVGLKPR